MVLETITERGVLSTRNSAIVANSTNTKSFNVSEGIAVSGSDNTITLQTDGLFSGLVIEIIYGTGANQCRLITDVTSSVATLNKEWDQIPDNTSKYIIHKHSGVCQTQTQTNKFDYVLLGTGASSINNFYIGAYIKFFSCDEQDQIFNILNYNGTSKIAELSGKINFSINNNTNYVIYGEGGVAQSGTNNTIVLDGNQSSIIGQYHYIELISGTGQGQIRMISSISTNTVTVSSDWDTNPDNTTRYTIFGGWGGSGFENVLRHSSVSVISTFNILDGERCVLELESSLDTQGINTQHNITEISALVPTTSHAMTIISQYFRIKVISMGTTLNGGIQTILGSYKQGKITSKLEESIHDHSDCQLTRSVIVGKTIGNDYKNIFADNEGNLSVSILKPLDGFGSLTMTQPRQYTEISFFHNKVDTNVIKTEVLNGGNVTVTNNICSISSGVNQAGRAAIYSRRKMRYEPGLAVSSRFAAVFSTPLSDSNQLKGYGDVCNGFFIGYNGTDFGILHRTGGYREIRRLTITENSTINDNITITLNGITSSNIAILSSDNVQQIARKVSAYDFSELGEGWDSYEENGDTVLFISRIAGSLSGSYSYTAVGSDSVGIFSSIQTGVSATDTWVLQENWNRNTCFGFYSMPKLNPSKGNVFEIAVQWLGFGNILFRMENPITGKFDDIHQIKYSNTKSVTSITNPNLPLSAFVIKTGSNELDSAVVQTASSGLFIMGDNNKNLGTRGGVMNWYSISNGNINTGTYYNVMTIRNKLVMNNVLNYSDVYLMAVSVGLNCGNGIQDGGVFTFFSMSYLSNSSNLTWTDYETNNSTIEYCKDFVSIAGGIELYSIPCPPNQTISMSVIDMEINILPGYTLICAFQPFINYVYNTGSNQTSNITFSVSWIQK